MVAPGANPGAHVLLLAPDHTGIGVPVLITLLRRGPEAAPQAAAGARDRAAGLPAAVLGAARRSGRRVQLRAPARPGLRHAAGGGRGPAAGRPVRAGRARHTAAPPPWRREADRHGYDLALLVAAVVSFGLTQLANRAITSLGGFYLHAIPARSQISSWATVPAQLRALGQNLMFLFGSNFWVKPQALTFFAYLHLVGLAVALIGLLIAPVELAEGGPGDAHARRRAVRRCSRRARSSPLMQPVSGTHEIAIMLPLGACLAAASSAGRRDGRVDGRPPAGRRSAAGRGQLAGPSARWRWRACSPRPGSATWATSATTPLGRHGPSVNQALADCLVAHHLTSGLGGYWDADVTALGSGGKVTSRRWSTAARTATRGSRRPPGSTRGSPRRTSSSRMSSTWGPATYP